MKIFMSLIFNNRETRNRMYNDKINYSDLIIERINQGIYSNEQVISVLIRWIGWGNNREFREMLKNNDMLLNDDE